MTNDIDLRWDDGSPVLDPDNSFRRSFGIDQDIERATQGSLDHFEEPHQPPTLNEWAAENGYNLETRQYDRDEC